MNSIKDVAAKGGFPVIISSDEEKLTSLVYAEFVQRLAKDMGSPTLDLLHAAVGVSGEAGELLDAVKKHWAYGKELDRENVIEELGDLMFYMQMMMMIIGVGAIEVIEANVHKLSKRYASMSYSNEQAIARADKTEGEQK